MSHSEAAARFIADEARTDWHDESIWFVRAKRDRASQSVPEWEALRERASEIKEHTLTNLDTYLERFEARAVANGIQVHWARDAAEHNRIVLDILQRHGVQRLVKSKSMLTEECHLNPYLEAAGLEVVDTDLGERIVQLLEEPPSHIVMPAIHLKKEDIGVLFHERLGSEAGATDPKYLTEVARQHLRSRFLGAEAAITGVNFAVAETGGFVVCTNEGNADLGVHLARVHIACMGIEKLIPRAEDLGVFTRLLARSATGQHMTVYTSHFSRPRPGTELHVVLVDNGRTEQLSRPDFWRSLKCIRCGACLNTCPIYRRSGGYSYQATIPGPIGAILSPGKDLQKHADLPFASTLCGSCSDVCPVKIDIHEQLYRWRQLVVQAGHLPAGKTMGMKMGGWVLRSAGRLSWAGAIGRRLLRVAPGWITRRLPWGRDREWPGPATTSFQQWYRKNRRAT
ncbi:MAG: lactate utilization protein B [Rhodothermales bacterium]